MGAYYVSFAELEQVITPEQAEKFCQMFGGVDWRVPARPKPEHRFAEVLNKAAFEALTRTYGGMMIRLPNGRRRTYKTEIIERIQQGESNRSIALALGVGQAYVESLSRVYRKEKKKMPLLETNLGAPKK